MLVSTRYRAEGEDKDLREDNKLLKAGIYAIINKQLNTVYVGETQDSFLV